MADVELLPLSIAEVAAKIRARQVSPVELTQAALTQADHL
jgi:Asp-tRNA(Asn)/Glu-tRNA(Gln) amidotransferase A subunit family amidase